MNHCLPLQNRSFEPVAVKIAARQKASQAADGQGLIGIRKVLYRTLVNRELLLLGKSSGRTSLLVWFRDGSVREYLCTVHRDLSLLQSALKRVHPSIEAEI